MRFLDLEFRGAAPAGLNEFQILDSAALHHYCRRCPARLRMLPDGRATSHFLSERSRALYAVDRFSSERRCPDRYPGRERVHY